MLIGIPALIGALLGKEDRSYGYLGGMLLGGALGAVIFAFVEHKLGPAEMKKGGMKIRFRNAGYDDLFRQMNHL